MADKNTEMTEQEANALSAEIFGDEIAVDADLEHEQATVGVEEENAGSIDSLLDSDVDQTQVESTTESEEAAIEATEEPQSSQSIDEILTDEGSSDFERVEVAPVETGMPDGELNGETQTTDVSINENEVENISRSDFDADLESVLLSAKAANDAANSVRVALVNAQNVKGYNKQAREERKQAIDTLNSAISKAETTAIDARTKATTLNFTVDSKIRDGSITEEDKQLAQQYIDNANEYANNADLAVKDAKKWQRKRAIVKSVVVAGIGLGAVAVVGSIGEIPQIWGNAYYQFSPLPGEKSNTTNDNEIVIDVDSLDLARIQHVLNGVFGNSTVKVETIKAIQVDKDNNYHLILDADKKGTDCLIDVNMGEQNGFTDTSALVQTLITMDLDKNDVDTYYALNSFVGDEAATNITIGLEGQMGGMRTASGGVWAKGSYATNRSGNSASYSADIDMLVFDKSGNACIINNAVTANSKQDFKNNLWNVVYYVYGGPATDFSGEIKQDATLNYLSPAKMTIQNKAGTASLSTDIDLAR